MKKFWIIIILIVVLLLALIIGNAIYCNNNFEIKTYKFKTNKLNTKFKIVFITDLHDKKYGEDNKQLVDAVKNQNPDFIAVGGDMVTRTNDNCQNMSQILPELAKIAPTYCVLGNHERDMMDKIDFAKEINSTGAVLLDNALIEFEKNGEKLIIGGLSDYPFYESYAPDYNTPERYFWDEFNLKADKKQYTILLHHQPEYIADKLSDTDIDLVICGHTHGGLIQIPFIGGLIAPNQGLFPKYDLGEYDLGKTKMIVSSGLGSSHFVPRINNCAELTVIEIN